MVLVLLLRGPGVAAAWLQCSCSMVLVLLQRGPECCCSLVLVLLQRGPGVAAAWSWCCCSMVLVLLQRGPGVAAAWSQCCCSDAVARSTARCAVVAESRARTIRSSHKRIQGCLEHFTNLLSVLCNRKLTHTCDRQKYFQIYFLQNPGFPK